ncbi:pyridoxal phosphate-dependent decarboxylase family protein [Gaopeijia maritima]|uniref:Pyridoxal-dependent decarboxylase n=1 Tax=Gaopeijia maritima TaxID=3119007 RepID=A0ABU9E804_9BACT
MHPPLHPPALKTRSPLDPDDWEGFREQLRAAADRLVDHVRDQRHWPVWQEMPDAVADRLLDPVTEAGAGAGRAWELLEDTILPYGVGNLHPRFMGWVHGAGTPGGLMAALAEAAINANLGGRNTGAARVERAVIDWTRRLFDFPERSSGILTSGTSMATVIALASARQAQADWDVEAEGLGAEGARFRLYTSEAAHSCVETAMRLLGFGKRAVRRVPTDDRGRMLTDGLHAAIRADRDAGLRPFAVVGTAGTVDIGAVDDLQAIADIADAENLWFHVDGAFGALLRLSPRLRERVDGIERADSIAFDFHKWLHVTYDCGCALIREESAHRAAFHGRPRYLEGQAEGLAAGDPWFCDYGPELSRGFRALRVWFLLVEHGTDALAEAIEGSVERAAHLAERVDAEPLLERVAPAALNIVCFRVLPLEGEDADALNVKVVAELQRRGIAAPSTTRIAGRVVIRCCLMNHRATRADMDVTVDGVLRIVEELRR